MNGATLLGRIANALAKSRLEAVLIGNAAAALHGAPLTTVDFDFMFRKTPKNLARLKKFATALDSIVLQPFHRASGLYRVMNDENGLQVDFMSAVDGVRSFAKLKAKAKPVKFGKIQILLADLADIIASKKAANRPRDRSVLELLKHTLHENQQAEPRKR